MAASSLMRLLPWLANPANPATSPHADGKKATCHTDMIYTVEKREGGGGGDNPDTMPECRMALQQTRGIHAHVDNRRPLTTQAYQCYLNACTGTGAQTNTTKYKGSQTHTGRTKQLELFSIFKQPCFATIEFGDCYSCVYQVQKTSEFLSSILKCHSLILASV